MKKDRNKNPVQPVSGTKVPRFAGPQLLQDCQS